MSYKLSVKREKQKAVMMFTSLHRSPSVLTQDLLNEQSLASRKVYSVLVFNLPSFWLLVSFFLNEL